MRGPLPHDKATIPKRTESSIDVARVRAACPSRYGLKVAGVSDNGGKTALPEIGCPSEGARQPECVIRKSSKVVQNGEPLVSVSNPSAFRPGNFPERRLWQLTRTAPRPSVLFQLAPPSLLLSTPTLVPASSLCPRTPIRIGELQMCSVYSMGIRTGKPSIQAERTLISAVPAGTLAGNWTLIW